MLRGLVVALLLAATACNKAPSEDQCKQLLDHLTDLELKKNGGAGTDKADLAKQKSAIVDAKLTDGFVEKCLKDMPRTRVECAINASDLDTGVARCDEGK